MNLPVIKERINDYEGVWECLTQMIIDLTLEKRPVPTNIYLCLDDHGNACFDTDQGSYLLYTIDSYEDAEDAWLVDEIQDTIAFDVRPQIQQVAYEALRERGISDKEGLYD